MSARKATKRIPRYKRWLESARRWRQSFAADLRETVERGADGAGRGRSKAKPKRPPRGGTWPMCAECFHRVPEVCPTCEKSWAGITRGHTSACCQCQDAPARNERDERSRPPVDAEVEEEAVTEEETAVEEPSVEGGDSGGGEVGPDIEGPSAPPGAPSAPVPAAPTPAPAMPAPAMPAPPIAAG